MNIENTIRNLKRRGFQARYFQTKEEAAAELAASLRHTTIGIGGCKTADQMGLYEILSAENEVIWHWKSEDRDAAQISAAHAKVYIMSANALSETGEIVNIDGNGNRIASMFYGHERVIFLVGINKLAPDLTAAIDRARNVASPLNARRFGRKTPCVLSEPMRCHDCSSPERICKGLAILMEKMSSIAEMDVYLIGEELGY
jgi:NAD-dependent dihydropyrimidine dehydrogenase PreA subunit